MTYGRRLELKARRLWSAIAFLLWLPERIFLRACVRYTALLNPERRYFSGNSRSANASSEAEVHEQGQTLAYLYRAQGLRAFLGMFRRIINKY